MTKKEAQKILRNIPDAPGVYFFLGPRKSILYIGKATSLKSRVRSYFDGNLTEKRSPLIETMVRTATQIEWTVTDSVLEAMVLEVNLIRTHKPDYNTLSKDDKSYNHLIITNETFPRILVVRGKDVTQKYKETELRAVFGPFPNATLFKAALKIIRKLFQYYDTSTPVEAVKSKMQRGQIDFNRQIGLYPDGKTPTEYERTIKHIILFFQGKKQKIIDELSREMMRYAKHQAFEEAAVLKKKIFALTHIQDVTLLKDEYRLYRDDRQLRIEAYDVAHFSGKAMVGVMVTLEGGVPETSGYRKFKIGTVTKAHDTAALREMLERRLRHSEWPLPQVVVVDGSTAQKNAAERVLKKHAVVIPVVGVVKDEKHNPKRIIGAQKLIADHRDAILLANAEAHRSALAYHKKARKNSFLTH